MQFDCDKNKLGIDYAHSDWSENREIVYNLVRLMKPERIVELGVYLGCSLFAFMQAIKDDNLKTELSGIDLWVGDKHMIGYDKDAYQKVSKINKDFYNNHAKLVKDLFDNQLKNFGIETIDILHIDGYHTYEAVKRDYDSWLCKVKKDGIILFHDIYVKKSDFGVYKLWNILKKLFTAIEIKGVNGLGILLPKGNKHLSTINKAILN